jgi:pseudoazurin
VCNINHIDFEQECTDVKRNLVSVAVAMSAGLFVLSPAAASAKNYEVQMVNKGTTGSMTFEPAFIQIASGDSVTFKPGNPGHNAESIPTMTPPGAATFKGAMSQPVTVTFTKAGLYGYKCAPHFGMGMVGLVEVGTKADKASAAVAAAKLPGMAKTRMANYVAQAR